MSDLKAFIDAVEKLAFEMRPPNPYTPRLVQMCNDARSLLRPEAADTEAVAWAYKKLLAYGAAGGSMENCLMLDRLKLMLLEPQRGSE